VIEQLMARSGMDIKMAKTCYHSHFSFKSFFMIMIVVSMKQYPRLASAAICKNEGVTDWYQRHGYREQVISSSPHSTIVPSDSDTEDAFSSMNILNYFPASSGNIFPNSLKKISSPKNTKSSTSATSTMNQDAIRQLIADITAILEAQVAAMANTDNPNRNTGPEKFL
ncbi:hypothetical protein Tco_1087189, partial [Tanacetum coccineum]